MVVTQSPASARSGRSQPSAEMRDASPEGLRADAELHLAETRHRLANCLTLINGLIGVRLRHTSDSESRRHLLWLLDMVSALGGLQQRLADCPQDDFAHYLGDVAAFWRRCGDDRRIAVEIDAESVVLPSAAASSLALIVHELVSNSFEHAFAAGQSGTVRITLRHADGACRLTVRDDGRGFPGGGPAGDRMGLALVGSLARRLGGAAEIHDGTGAAVTVRFPVGEGFSTEMSTTAPAVMVAPFNLPRYFDRAI